MSTNNPANKKDQQLYALALMNLPGQAQINAQANMNSALKNQMGFSSMNSAATRTTAAKESADGKPKYTPGRTNESPAVEKKTAPTTKPTTYTVNEGNQPYVNQLNALYDRIMNRQPFQYDINSDLLYQQMADQYAQMGAQASRNAMGQAAALTGGYGNSYAQQVGNQAYQQYMTALNEQIPALYQQAYNVYQGDTDRLLQQYELAAQHPIIVDSLSPKTYTVSSASDSSGDSDGTGDFAAALLKVLASGNAYSNELANWVYNPYNKK